MGEQADPSTEIEIDSEWAHKVEHPCDGVDAGRNLFWLEGLRLYILVRTEAPDRLIIRFLVQGEGRFIAKRYLSNGIMVFLTREYMRGRGTPLQLGKPDDEKPLGPFIPDRDMIFQLAPGNDISLDGVVSLLRKDSGFFTEPTPRAVPLYRGG